MGLKHAIARWRVQSDLRKFKRVYRWYNAEDVKPGMTVFLQGKHLEIGDYNLALLGRITLASKSTNDPLSMYQVIVTAHKGYQTFFSEGADLDPHDVLVSDLKRVTEDPIFSPIFSTKRIRTGIVEEVCLVLNNEPLRNFVKRVRDQTLRRVEFPYWNMLATGLLAARILQNGQVYRFVSSALIGSFLAGYRYLTLSDKAWKSLAASERGGEVINEVAESLKAEHPEQIRWIYGNLPDRKSVAEIIDHSMFLLGRIQKEATLLREPAQAVALARVYDAGRHDRPYRKGLSQEEILNDLEQIFLSGWNISADGTVTERGKIDPKVWDGFKNTIMGTERRM